MVEITLKFPKKPKTSQRKKIQDLCSKYDYSEDEYDSITKFNSIDPLSEILNIIGYWGGVEIYLGDIKVDCKYVKSLIECIEQKLPFTRLKWFGLESYSFNSEEDFSNILEKLESYEDFENLMEYKLERLIKMKFMQVIC